MDFFHSDKIQTIKQKFLNAGWINIYNSSQYDEFEYSEAIYCCLIKKDYKEKYLENYSWPFSIGSEGRPTVYNDNEYSSYGDDNIEPFLYKRRFTFKDRFEGYIDISEEFILYFDLYEELKNKHERKYYFIDNNGNLEEVIIIEKNHVYIKLKYLKEYISIRKMCFSIFFEFMALDEDIEKYNEKKHFEKNIIENDIVYNFLYRNVIGKDQSWIIGKCIYDPDITFTSHFDNTNENQRFITGYDDNGDYRHEYCDNTNKNYFKLTYFKKDVLDKYYNKPNEYKVESYRLSSNFISLKIDNNREDYISVFLSDLSSLPEDEQLHWKQYNIPPEKGMGISYAYYQTMIKGNWNTNIESIDHYFKSKYMEVNEKWNQKYSWYLYKPIHEQDEHIFKSLHIPSTDNVKDFCEQILSLVKLIIDRLNEKELQKKLQDLSQNTKGITKLEKFLESEDLQLPEMIEFLRNLQSLRSGLIAHSFSEKNKDCKKAMKYFNLLEGKYKESAKDIFIKAIWILNTIEDVL